MTDLGHRDRCPGREDARLVLVADGAYHGGAALAVPGVQHPAQLIVALKVGVGLIEEQRGAQLVDRAKDGRRGRVAGHQGPGDKRLEQIERGRLAAAPNGRVQGEARTDVEGVEAVGVHGPERQRLEGAPGQHQEASEGRRQVVEQRDTIDLLRPGRGVAQHEQRLVGCVLGRRPGAEGRIDQARRALHSGTLGGTSAASRSSSRLRGSQERAACGGGAQSLLDLLQGRGRAQLFKDAVHRLELAWYAYGDERHLPRLAPG